MGALTSNRKRGDEYLNYQIPYQNLHISKRPRFNYTQQNQNQTLISSNSTVSRMSRYPEAKPPLKREVHAPCRTLKYGFADKSNQAFGSKKANGYGENQNLGIRMGNVLRYHLEKAKKSAFGAFRYFSKDKEVIDADNEQEKVEVISDDSSVEEIEAIEDGREGRSLVFNPRPRGSDENEKPVVDIGEIDGKSAEERNYHTNLQPSSSSVITDTNNGDVLKMIDSLSLNGEMTVDVYKKLLQSVQKRGSKLKEIEFEIELNEKRWASLKQLWPLKKPEEEQVEELPREPFIPLTKEEEAEVERAFSANWRAVLVSHTETGIDITGKILQCLRPGAWLNDEVINVYLGLLKEREKREPQKFLKCHFFNTFFYNKLACGNKGYDFRAVKRWTSAKKLGYGLIECDKIFVPIHKQIHWCLAVIDRKDRKFQYLDSLKGRDKKVLGDLARYFVEEVRDKCGKDIDVSDWEQEFVLDLPEQANGFDCGMFLLKYVDFYSRGLGLCFDQSHMPYFRVRTAKEILRLRAD
ncbi:hypothetical protein AB3S75_044139 [Citrus x aurantiifolia]